MADLCLPRCCTVCDRPLMMEEDVICLPCLADLPVTGFARMSHNPMADALNERISRMYPDEGGIPYCYAAALLYYSNESPYRQIPRKLKYGRDFREGAYFARMLGRELASSRQFADVDTVVPVPLHWKRKRERGYNQAELIAAEVAAALPFATLDKTLLERTRFTSTQTALETEAKEANVRGAFKCRRSRTGTVPRHILIVDDVFTSGATSGECFRALYDKYGGGTRFSVATLSFVHNDNA